MEGADGTGTIIGSPVGLDPQPVGSFIEGVSSYQCPCGTERLSSSVIVDQRGDQEPEDVTVEIAQLVPARDQPVVLLTGEQVTPIVPHCLAATLDEMDRFVRVGLERDAGRGHELVDIDDHGRIATPLQCRRGGDDRGIDGRIDPTERVQYVAQVGARLRVGGLRPEGRREALARMSHTGLKHEVGQEPSRPARPQAFDRNPFDVRAHLTQEPQLQVRAHGDDSRSLPAWLPSGTCRDGGRLETVVWHQ